MTKGYPNNPITQPPRDNNKSVSRKVTTKPSPSTKTTVAPTPNSAQQKKKNGNSSGSEVKVNINLPKPPSKKEQTESPQTTEITENKEESKPILENTNEVEIIKSPEDKPPSVDDTVLSESDSSQTTSITVTLADGTTIVTEGKEKNDG